MIAEMGFWAIHVDTMLWSIGLGALFCFFYAKAANTQHPAFGGLQNYVELIMSS